MSPIVEVEHLSKHFGSLKAVNDISFQVNEGDIYGFLGQNGAGKSTTIRMLLTLIQPTAGKIKIFGKDLSKHRSSILSNIGAVIEKPDLYKYLSAYDNLSIFARINGVKADRSFLLKRLQMVGLEGRASDKVKTFSQGMKQRLGIAVALVHDPQLIILDEPTNGLDPQGIADMRNLIIDLSKEHGKTIIVSSHLLHEIELMANRMIIIHKGRKMVEGDVSVLLDPSQSLVQIETSNIEQTRSKIMSSAWGQFLQPNHLKLHLKMHKNDVPKLTADLVAMNEQILSVSSAHALENYFISLTNEHTDADAFAN